MKFNKLAVVAVSAFCLLQSGCTDKKKSEELESANKSLQAEAQSLRDQLRVSSKQLAQTRQELDRTKAQIAAMQTEVAHLQSQSPGLEPNPAEPAVPMAKIPVAQEEFKRAVIGMTPEQLVRYVGKPLGTSSDGARQYWDYDAITYDSVTGKSDRRAQVLFMNGRVDGVIFVP